MNSTNPSIAVIICTRDRPADLINCLQSIAIQSPLPDQVVVVSGSEASCRSDVEKQFPTLNFQRVDCHEHNISKSRNAGLEVVETELVLFIDDDAIAREGWIKAYINAADEHPQAWALGGDVFDSRNSPPTVEFSNGIVSPTGSQVPVIVGVEASESDHLPQGYKPSVKGCNFAIRRDQITNLGGFDPYFTFAYDESDLMMTIHQHNGQVVHAPKAVVDHAHTPGHFRQDNPMDQDWRTQYSSHTMFMLKHTEGSMRFCGWFIIYRRFVKMIFKVLLGIGFRKINARSGYTMLRSVYAGIIEAKRAYKAKARI